MAPQIRIRHYPGPEQARGSLSRSRYRSKGKVQMFIAPSMPPRARGPAHYGKFARSCSRNRKNDKGPMLFIASGNPSSTREPGHTPPPSLVGFRPQDATNRGTLQYLDGPTTTGGANQNVSSSLKKQKHRGSAQYGKFARSISRTRKNNKGPMQFIASKNFSTKEPKFCGSVASAPPAAPYTHVRKRCSEKKKRRRRTTMRATCAVTPSKNKPTLRPCRNA